MAPALPVTGDDADKADGGNGVTIGRIARIVSEETGLASRLRLPCDLPIDKADDFEAFLAAADIALLVVLHAFKCGTVLDAAAAGNKETKVVLVLGGTDVNVDAASGDKAALLKKRASAVDAIVAFSNSMVAAAPPGTFPPGKTVVIAQGVQLLKEEQTHGMGTQSQQPEHDETEPETKKPSLNRQESLHCVLGVSKSTPVFLCPAGLRPVKDLLWAVDALEAVSERTSSTTKNKHNPPFVFAIVGPVLDEAYAEAVANRIAKNAMKTLALLPAVSRYGLGAFPNPKTTVCLYSYQKGLSPLTVCHYKTDPFHVTITGPPLWRTPRPRFVC